MNKCYNRTCPFYPLDDGICPCDEVCAGFVDKEMHCFYSDTAGGEVKNGC